MQSVIARGAGCSNSPVPDLTVTALRRNILAVVIGCPLFTDAEQVKTNHSVYECADAAQLSTWLKNVQRLADERELADLRRQAVGPQAPATLADLANPAYVAANGQRPYAHGLTVAQAAAGLENLRQSLEQTSQAATPQQCDELHRLAGHPLALPAERAQTLLLLPSYTEAQAEQAITKLQAAITRRSGQPVPVQVVEPAQPTAPAEPQAPAPLTPAQLDELRRLAGSPCLTPAERRTARHALHVAGAGEAHALLTQLRRLGSTPRLRLTQPVAVAGRAVAVTVAERLYEAAKVDYVRDEATGRALPRYEACYGGPLVQRVWVN